jgi:dTDP-4-amino-4,6-dideoxygalactose transaminase
MTAGEGGLITTNNKDFEEKCQSLTNCGRKETGYNNFDGELFGWNYRITEWQAAILTAQLGRFKKQMKIREKNKEYFARRIKEIKGIALLKRGPKVPRRAASSLSSSSTLMVSRD